MITKERYHYTHEYLLNPQHPITVLVIGAGGTGSQMLSQLARINQALLKLGHPGLYVTCYDDDIVSEANIGRQLFSPGDVGQNKASVLITRLNMFFGTQWQAIPQRFQHFNEADEKANIVVTCVDSVSARLMVDAAITKSAVEGKGYRNPYSTLLYWLDLGNSQKSGQFVLGTVTSVSQPKKSKTIEAVEFLPNIFRLYPGFKTQKTKETGPSCSLAEALTKQDLFVNSVLVQFASNLIWKMFREGRIKHQGAFINLETMDLAPINI